MHLGNGAITPECAALTMGAAAVGLTACGWDIRRSKINGNKAALAAALGGLIFAAQAINVPIAPGASAHLVGGVLFAWLLGPGLGAWTMAVVLLLQAIFLGDGGGMALGANILNMAILPAALVAFSRRILAAENDDRRSLAVAGVLAAVAVPLAALLIVGQTAAFRSPDELAGWTSFAALMLGTHLWIGLLEGLATSLVIASYASLSQRASITPLRRVALAGAIACFIAVALLLPVSSSLPDGYEAAAETSGLSWLLR